MAIMGWILLSFASIYTLGLFTVSNSMKKRAYQLKKKIKKLLALQFIEKSTDLLTQSEFSELMEEISFLVNTNKIDTNHLFLNLYERFPKIEKELEELLVRVSLVNRSDILADQLISRSKTLKLTAALMFIAILIDVTYKYFCPDYHVFSFSQIVLVGLIIVSPLSIYEAMKIFYESDKILRLISKN